MKAASVLTDLAIETFQNLSRGEHPKELQVLVHSAARERVTEFDVLRERLLLRAGLSEMQPWGAGIRD
jgi:hypothetical protein